MRLLLLLLKLPLATNFVLLIFPNFGIFVSLSNSDVINKNAFACKVYCKCAIKQVFKIHFSNSWSPLILGRRSNTSHSNLHDRNLFIRDVIFFHESYALDCISCMQNSKKCWSSIIGQFRCPKNVLVKMVWENFEKVKICSFSSFWKLVFMHCHSNWIGWALLFVVLFVLLAYILTWKVGPLMRLKLLTPHEEGWKLMSVMSHLPKVQQC